MNGVGGCYVDVDYWRENVAVVVVVVRVDGPDKVDGRDEAGQITLRGKDVAGYGWVYRSRGRGEGIELNAGSWYHTGSEEQSSSRTMLTPFFQIFLIDTDHVYPEDMIFVVVP